MSYIYESGVWNVFHCFSTVTMYATDVKLTSVTGDYGCARGGGVDTETEILSIPKYVHDKFNYFTRTIELYFKDQTQTRHKVKVYDRHYNNIIVNTCFTS